MATKSLKKKPGTLPSHLVAGNPGNSGGGRPANSIRAECRQAFSERIDDIVGIARGDEQVRWITRGEGEPRELRVTPTDGDRLRAVDLLGRYGQLDKLHKYDPDLISSLGAATLQGLLDMGFELTDADRKVLTKAWGKALAEYVG